MRALVSVLRALGNVNRLRMCAALRGGELCVCQVADLLHMSTSTAKHHLNILARAGLVQATRRSGSRWAYYRLSEAGTPAVRIGIGFVQTAVVDEPILRADAGRLPAVLRRYPSEACAASAPRPSKAWKREAKASLASTRRKS